MTTNFWPDRPSSGSVTVNASPARRPRRYGLQGIEAFRVSRVLARP